MIHCPLPAPESPPQMVREERRGAFRLSPTMSLSGREIEKLVMQIGRDQMRSASALLPAEGEDIDINPGKPHGRVISKMRFHIRGRGTPPSYDLDDITEWDDE